MVHPVNDPPTLSGVPAQATDEDTPPAAIPFSIGDVETPADSLTVRGQSFNPGLVPNGNIVLSGSGSNRTVTLFPAANQFGTAKITISVTDADGASASRSFVLTVNPVNDPPTLSGVANQSTDEDTPTAARSEERRVGEACVDSWTVNGQSFKTS